MREDKEEGDTCLLVDKLAQLRIAMAKRIHSNPCSKVYVPTVLHIPQIAATAPRKHRQWPCVCGDHVLFVVCNQARGARV